MGNHRIDRQTGKALEAICHAIDYLIDEYKHQRIYDASTQDAVDLLQARRRELLYATPVTRPLFERIKQKVWNM